MIIETIIEEMIATELGHFLRRSAWRLRFVRCSVVHPAEDIRVAFSALLRIADSDRYLLVRNLHRPETFGPYGGVYKYYDDAQPVLDSIDFKPQVFGPGDDMKKDIRGFLPRKNLAKLVQWYGKSLEREPFKECLCRELKEELLEIGLPKIRCPDGLQFRLVRTAREGPAAVPGEEYTQFRIFEVYDLYPVSLDTQKFIRQLFRAAKRHKNLLAANAKEIIRGRASNGAVSGHHAGYLIGRKRVRPDTPAIVEQHKPQL